MERCTSEDVLVVYQKLNSLLWNPKENCETVLKRLSNLFQSSCEMIQISSTDDYMVQDVPRTVVPMFDVCPDSDENEHRFPCSPRSSQQQDWSSIFIHCSCFGPLTHQIFNQLWVVKHRCVMLRDKTLLFCVKLLFRRHTRGVIFWASLMFRHFIISCGWDSNISLTISIAPWLIF